MTPELLGVAQQHVEQYTRSVLKYAAPNMRFVLVRAHPSEAVGLWGLERP
jgi:hypothetical protein